MTGRVCFYTAHLDNNVPNCISQSTTEVNIKQNFSLWCLFRKEFKKAMEILLYFKIVRYRFLLPFLCWTMNVLIIVILKKGIWSN